MDDEDDYLSDKFLSQLASSSSAKPTTYADRRKEAQRLAHIRNEQGRTKSRKELEEESRREGLSKSLFERAKEEGDVGGNKAMAMMLKMGYKPGQALGKDSSQLTPAPTKASEEVPTAGTSNRTSHEAENPNAGSSSRSGHLVEPISVSMWAGRKGLGLGPKRPASPTSSTSRPIKLARLENEEKEAYRDRVRADYEERRAEGKLISATKTCITLDDKSGLKFNVLWLNPHDPGSWPPGLVDRVTARGGRDGNEEATGTAQEHRLREQMRADALEPLSSLVDDEEDRPKRGATSVNSEVILTENIITQAGDFLNLNARERLAKVILYLRDVYSFCFWCGLQYESKEEMDRDCPGEDKEAHD